MVSTTIGRLMTLVNCSSGVGWAEAVKVQDSGNITEEEFCEITGGYLSFIEIIPVTKPLL